MIDSNTTVSAVTQMSLVPGLFLTLHLKVISLPLSPFASTSRFDTTSVIKSAIQIRLNCAFHPTENSRLILISLSYTHVHVHNYYLTSDLAQYHHLIYDLMCYKNCSGS